MAAYKLVLIRHGESKWNQENRFCGWFDADLSETGVQEAERGGKALQGGEKVLLYCNNWNVWGVEKLWKLGRKCYYTVITEMSEG